MLHAMRTTLDIDDDVRAAAKELSRRQSVSAGKVLSQLARHRRLPAARRPEQCVCPLVWQGFGPSIHAGTPVTNEIIDSLRDAAGV